MKKILLNLAMMLLIAGLSFAAGIQGEVVEIKGNEIRIEILGEDRVSLETGSHVSLEVIPAGVPTLDMLQG